MHGQPQFLIAVFHEFHSTAELLTNSITNNLGANETGKFKSKI